MARKNWIGQSLDNPRRIVKMGSNHKGRNLSRHKTDNKRRGSITQATAGNYAWLPVRSKS